MTKTKNKRKEKTIYICKKESTKTGEVHSLCTPSARLLHAAAYLFHSVVKVFIYSYYSYSIVLHRMITFIILFSSLSFFSLFLDLYFVSTGVASLFLYDRQVRGQEYVK